MKIFNFNFFQRNIDDLNGINMLSGISNKQLREKTSILIIDDTDFPLQDPLKSLGFCFTNKNGKTGDINLNDYIHYDIILCDIAGVATKLNAKYEGAFLAAEIKRAYPEKIVISYTANGYNADMYEYQKQLDGIVPKGQGIDEWSSLLDKNIKLLADPREQWKRYRARLLKENVDINLVASIESNYVKAVLSNDFTSFQRIYSKDHRFQQVVESLLASLMVKILTSTF